MPVEWLKTLLLLVFAWLFALVLLKLLSGSISLKGLTKRTASGKDEPERLQAVVVALGGAIIYGFLGLQLIGESGVTSLPEVPEFLLAGVTGSQFLYLFAKAYRQGR